jgi:hypothetical protein
MIFVECDPDFVLAKSLTRGKEVEHSFGKSKVCDKLEELKHCTGMLDEDPKSAQHPYINKLQKSELKKEIPEHDLKVLHDKKNNNQVILLCPRLEEWILKAVQAENMEIGKYYLPEKPSKLHDALTFGHERNKGNYKRLLSDLAEGSNRLKTLKSLLETSR